MKLTDIIKGLITNFTNHTEAINPHNVTAEQIGLPPAVINSPEWIDLGPSGFLAGRYFFAGMQYGKPRYERADGVAIAYELAEEWYMIVASGPEGGWWREENGAQKPEDIAKFIPETPEAVGDYDAVLTSKLPRELIQYYAGTI